MDKRIIVIIWHQAGGRDENSTYYPWADEKGNTKTFESMEAAKHEWQESGMNQIHAGFPVDCSASKQRWL